ncbi:MAG: TIGR02281 family clan AA aspartic protease [Gallionellaceae bacterium]|nr:TIGR02281 family clan AA aspartic protease [Gallionellaceae bacterium]
MTESDFNELTAAVAERIAQLARNSGVVIKHTLNGTAVKLEFADGQRILISPDILTRKIWLAAGSVGMEYSYSGERWLAQQDGSELYAKFAELLHQVIHSNPLNTRPGKLLAASHSASLVFTEPDENSHPLKKIAVLGLLAGLGYAGFQHFSAMTPHETSLVAESALSKCDATFPANGASYIFPAAPIQQGNPDNTDITLQNDHGHSFLASFTAPKTVIPYLSVWVQSGQSTHVGLPAGQYDMLLSLGNSWCNLHSGFLGGERIKLNTTLNVLAQQPLQLIAQSAGVSATDFQIIIKSSAPPAEPPPFRFIGNGVMEIRQHTTGHYHIAGAVNGTPLTFMIDTGASLTSLSTETAQSAGIRDCKPATFNTANGTVTGCTALAAQLTIGGYQLQNVNIAVMPNMAVNLLGMNVLNNFDMTQNNGVMHLSHR